MYSWSSPLCGLFFVNTMYGCSDSGLDPIDHRQAIDIRKVLHVVGYESQIMDQRGSGEQEVPSKCWCQEEISLFRLRSNPPPALMDLFKPLVQFFTAICPLRPQNGECLHREAAFGGRSP